MPEQSARSEATRATIDTNVWVSGLINPNGPPGAVLHAVRAGALVAVASRALTAEIVAVLSRSWLRERYGISDAELSQIREMLEELPGEPGDTPVLRDPRDHPVLDSAGRGGVSLVITGDRDLLDSTEAHSWLDARGITLRTPRQWLQAHQTGGAERE